MRTSEISEPASQIEYAFVLKPSRSVGHAIKHLYDTIWFNGASTLLLALLLQGYIKASSYNWWEPLLLVGILAILIWSILKDIWNVINNFVMEESLQLYGKTLRHSRKLQSITVYLKEYSFSQTTGFQYHIVRGKASAGKHPTRSPQYGALKFNFKEQEILAFKNIPQFAAEEVAAQLNSRNPNNFR